MKCRRNNSEIYNEIKLDFIRNDYKGNFIKLMVEKLFKFIRFEVKL